MLSGSGVSDWAGDIATRKSGSGYVVQPDDGLVACRSFKQRFVASSSTESEYVPIDDFMQKVRSFQHMLGVLEGLNEPTVIHEDNPPCTWLTTEQGKRNKLVDVSSHILAKVLRKERLRWSTAIRLKW